MLFLLTLLYLTVPYALFFLGWLKGPYAVACVGILGVGLALSASRSWSSDRRRFPRLQRQDWVHLVLVGLLIVGWVWLSGAGGLGYQRGDWRKHNAILNALVKEPWPVQYDGFAGVPGVSYLTYYIAYYLPAGLVGKLFGLRPAHIALYVWTVLGAFISAAWLFRLVQRRSWLVLGAFTVLGGLDALGALVRFHPLTSDPFVWWVSPERLLQYSSNTTLLFWVPQHALSGWILTAVLVDRIEHVRSARGLLFLSALSAFWSPFVTIGLIPIVAVGLARSRLAGVLSIEDCVVGPVLLLVTGLFLGAVDAGKVPSGWYWELRTWGVLWIALFCLLEFGVYAALCASILSVTRPDPTDRRHRRGAHVRPADRRDARCDEERYEAEVLVYSSGAGEEARTDPKSPPAAMTRTWLLIAVVGLLLLPTYRLGHFGDLCMRGSVPLLFLLWVVVLRIILSLAAARGRWQWHALVFCLGLGAIPPMMEIGQAVAETQPYIRLRGGWDVSLSKEPEFARHQYLGRPDAFFYKHLAAR